MALRSTLRALAPLLRAARKPAAGPKIETDFMQQLAALKSFDKYGIFPIIRVGNFYEFYFEHAVQASRILNLTLTSKTFRLLDEPKKSHPFCGFPLAQLPRQIAILTGSGNKNVALIDETTIDHLDKRKTRRLRRIFTPGNLTELDLAQASPNNSFVLSFGPSKESDAKAEAVELVFTDLSTGELHSQQAEKHLLADEISRVDPIELVLSRAQMETLDASLKQRITTLGIHLTYVEDLADCQNAPLKISESSSATEILDRYLQLTLLKEAHALGETSHKKILQEVTLDMSAFNALDIRRCAATGSARGSLMSTISRTATPGGHRTLLRRLATPSASLPTINARLDAVQFFMENNDYHQDMRSILTHMVDGPRLQRRLATRKHPTDLQEFASMCTIIADIGGILNLHRQDIGPDGAVPSLFADLENIPVEFDQLRRRIEAALPENAMSANAAALTDDVDQSLEEIEASASEEDTVMSTTWRVRPSATPDLAKLHQELSLLEEEIPKLKTVIAKEHNVALHRFEMFRDAKGTASLRAPTGVRFKDLPHGKSNKTSTYFVESRWIQLARDCDKVKSEIAKAEVACIADLHRGVFAALDITAKYDEILIEVDLAQSFAQLAKEYNYVRPEVDLSNDLVIERGRHPTVEIAIHNSNKYYEPNSISMTKEDGKFVLITGPNMGGKSTFLRQVALTVLLAQTGSYVPAASARIGIVDRIFTRIGAQDSLFQGRSTFMQEMTEVSEVLQHANERSLVLLDEVGRGTSPAEGLAIAYAVADHITGTTKCRALFATHLHAMSDMLGDSVQGEKVVKLCTQLEQDSETGEIKFDYTLKPGVNSQSHGVALTRVCNFPAKVVALAEATLQAQK